VVISAHNEELVIGAKLENALSLDYPQHDRSFWVSSDGSTDRTNEIVELIASSRDDVHLCAYRENRGKTASLMDTIARLPGEIEVVVFSDANAMYAPDALRELVAPLADPAVGAVTGELTYTGGSAEGLYRRYENWIKRAESALRTCVVAEGSIFAVRRPLIPLLEDWQIEDMAIPLAVTLAGYAVRYQATARSFETFVLDTRGQFRRRKRIANRAIRSTLAAWRILDPCTVGIVAVMYFSHRVMRWLAPLSILVGGVAAAILVALTAPLSSIAGAAAFALVALSSFACLRGGRAAVRVPIGFVIANAAILAGIASVATGTKIVVWKPVR
jgi:cellulose synthase/poly-beta-1,6-N-acetylglucosamine synthase-like glycosyltransferase